MTEEDSDWRRIVNGFYRAVLEGVVWYIYSDPLLENFAEHRKGWITIRDLRCVGGVSDSYMDARWEVAHMVMEGA